MKKFILLAGILLCIVLYSITFYKIGVEASKQEYYSSNMNNMQVDLPEEISELDSTDLLTGYWKNNVLYLKYKSKKKIITNENAN